MVDIINVFLTAFSGVVSGIVDLEFGGYKIGAVLFGAFVLGVVFSFVVKVLRR